MKKNILIIIILIALIPGFYFLARDSQEDKIQEESETKEMVSDSSEEQELQIEVLKQGTGEEVKNGDNIPVHYTGVLEDGTKFDSSLDRGKPFVFTLGIGQVIKGWDEGTIGMKIGEKRKLTVPPELGYGDRGVGNIIQPNATLIFEIELVSVN